MVLHELRLVEHEPCPRERVVRVVLDPEQRVRGHDDIGTRNRLGQRRTPSRLGLGDRHRGESGGEPLALARPVLDDARRRHHQERRRDRSSGTDTGDHREGLQRLAEPHVIGEDAAEPVLVEEGQPTEPVALVGPQRRAYACGHVDGRDRVEIEQAVDSGLPAATLLVDDAQLHQLAPQARLKRTDPQAVGLAVLQRAGFLDQSAETIETRVVDAEVRTGVQDQMGVAASECGEQLFEGDVLAADTHSHAQVEPVGLVGIVGCRDADARRVGRGCVGGRVAGDHCVDLLVTLDDG